MTKVKAKTDELETPAILSQKTLKLKMIVKLEKLIHVMYMLSSSENNDIYRDMSMYANIEGFLTY